VKAEDFLLGTHEAHWLSKAGYPLFVSRRRLIKYRVLPTAIAPWGMDSGGFAVLDKTGEWDTTEADYIKFIRRCRDEIGMLKWVAPMDWMCEPRVRAKTGKTVYEHLKLTVGNYIRLRYMDDSLPIRPVLQGFSLDDYKRCADLYAQEGVDLTREPLVGLGSVCRRQDTAEIALIAGTFSGYGIRLHGFGVKTKGLALYHDSLVSSDSMAWSFTGRREPPLPGCTTHINCANCLIFATAWRTRLLAGLS
jgi:hypothetical protein